MIITSAALVERFKLPLPEGQDIAYPTFIDRDELVELWKPIVAAVQSRGARIAMQIVHPGREEDPGLRLGEPPVAPSPVEGSDIQARRAFRGHLGFLQSSPAPNSPVGGACHQDQALSFSQWP